MRKLQSEAISANADHIRRFYRIGVAFTERYGPRKAHGDSSASEFAAEHGISVHQLAKARKFAARYTPQELEALCKLKTPVGKPLPMGQVFILSNVRDRSLRRNLQAYAASQGWSCDELRTQCALAAGAGRPVASGGTTPEPPESVDRALVEIRERVEKWRRSFAGWPPRGEKGAHVVRKIPRRISLQLMEVHKAMDLLDGELKDTERRSCK